MNTAYPQSWSVKLIASAKPATEQIQEAFSITTRAETVAACVAYVYQEFLADRLYELPVPNLVLPDSEEHLHE